MKRRKDNYFMKELNYLKLLKYPNVQLMGFKEVKGFIYVSISRISPLLVIYNKNIEEREYRFRVDIKNPEKKIVQNPRLYHLLNHFELNGKAFIYNEKNKMYVPTDILIAE